MILNESEPPILDEQQTSKNKQIPAPPTTELNLRPWRLLSMVLRQNELQEICEAYVDDDRPPYLSLNSWMNLKRLEIVEPASFRNLGKSLREDSVKWREYFWPHNNSSSVDLVEKDVDLLNETPFGNKMSFLEKLAIWFSARPDKVTNE